MHKIDPQLDLELSAFICGWDALEKKRGGEDIIDMNLSPLVEPKKYDFRFEVLQDIERFLDMKEVQGNGPVFRKMTAHHAYLRHTMGEIIPYDIYLNQTMGIKPVLFTDQKIKGLRQLAEEALDVLGLKINEDIEDQLGAVDGLLDKSEISAFYATQHDNFFGGIKHHIAAENVAFNVAYNEMDENVAKIAEIRGDGKDYKVLSNLYHMSKHSKSNIACTAVHELTGHAVQFAIQRQQADAGLMPRYMTYLTTHDDTQFGAEGLAETGPYFFPEQFLKTPAMDAILKLQRLRRVAMNNAAVMVNQGASFRECVQYRYDCCPDKALSRMGNQLEFVANKPLGSSYYSIYGQAKETFIEIAGSNDDKIAFIRSIYHGHTAPDAIIAQTKRPVAEFV